MFKWITKPNPEPVQDVKPKTYEVFVDFTNGAREEWPEVELVWVYDGGLVSIRTTDGDVTLFPVRTVECITMMPNTGAPDETE